MPIFRGPLKNNVTAAIRPRRSDYGTVVAGSPR